MQDLPLGQQTTYPERYDPSLLCAVPRANKRQEMGLTGTEFSGKDIWNAYELSWLNDKGKPQVAIGELIFDAHSPNIIESKSLKLYCNSFNQERFTSWQQVETRMTQDLSEACGREVSVKLYALDKCPLHTKGRWQGILIDELDVEINDYQYNPALLAQSSSAIIEETLISHLLKSNCLITSQPDWASVLIHYRGPAIDHASLLKYLVSFRSHNEFHEQCVERIFADIKKICGAEKLSVYARYTRRGGLDINPFRSDWNEVVNNQRLIRQ